MQAGVSDADGSADYRLALSTGHCRLYRVCGWQQGAQQVPAACKRPALDGLRTTAACCWDSLQVLLYGSSRNTHECANGRLLPDLSWAACCEHRPLSLLSAVNHASNWA